MKQTTTTDLALDETAELTILDASGAVAHTLTIPEPRGGQDVITLPGDHPAALWLVEQQGPDAIHATLVRGSVRVNCALESWQVRAVDPCPSCNHSGSVLDTWWRWIDTIIGAPTAASGAQALNPTP